MPVFKARLAFGVTFTPRSRMCFVIVMKRKLALFAKFISPSTHLNERVTVFPRVTLVQKNPGNPFVRMTVSAFFMKELVYRLQI